MVDNCTLEGLKRNIALYIRVCEGKEVCEKDLIIRNILLAIYVLLEKLLNKDNTKMKKLQEPKLYSRIIREGTIGECPVCHSTLHSRYFLGLIQMFKSDKCINPECPNYYKKGKKMRTDKERLDLLEQCAHGWGNGWVCRESITGRGIRLHETRDKKATKSIRDAIDSYLDLIEERNLCP